MEAATDIELPSGVRLVRTLRGHAGPIGQVAWSPDGRLLATASADRTVRIWDTSDGRCVHCITKHVEGVRAVAFDGEGTLLATGDDRGTIKLWRVDGWRLFVTLGVEQCTGLAFGPGSMLVACGETGARVWDASTGDVLHNHRRLGFDLTGVAVRRDATLAVAGVSDGTALWNAGEQEAQIRDPKGAWDVAFDPTRNAVAVAYDDGGIGIADADSGELRAVLEGHTGAARSVAYSHDGRFLASKSDDDVRVWDSATGTCLAVLPVPWSGWWTPKIAFEPASPLLAAVGADEVYIVELDESILGATPRHGVTYTSAKIVLVGDSGVGKTGLGWRLAHGEFKPHESTHGQQFWMLDELRHIRADGAECEAVLWDLAGQPDYRLVHALFLDDADLALVLFDPTKDEDPLRGVEYWLGQLGGGSEVLLVAARADRGVARLTADEIAAFCEDRGVRGYLVTSARTGEGLHPLVDRIRTSIAWESKPATVTTETFKRIKDDVLTLREDPRQKIIVSRDELRASLEHDPDLADFSDDEMLTAVGHLSNHGYVARLTTSRAEVRILLAPELLNNVAASIVLKARRNERSLGSLEEACVLADEYRFRELEALAADDRDVLLDSAVAMFLGHNICFRETDPLTSKAYLVFPELINLKKPVIDDEQPTVDGVAYTVTGAVENVYASLVVLLGYTSTFTRANQWRNHARYVVGEGLVCGFRVDSEREGQLDFVLYFGADVGESFRRLFQGLFESFLARRDLEVRRYEPVICKNGHRLNRAVVREALAEGSDSLFCSHCGERVPLGGAEAPLALTDEVGVDLVTEHRTADARSRFEQVLFRLHAHITQEGLEPPECFISYAWGKSEQERWVEQRLATDLTKGGITVVLDRWENARIGASVPRFMERAASADRVIVVGTPEYRRKYDNNQPMRGFAVAAEGDLIGMRLMGTEEQKQHVLPVLLEGTETSFPELLQPRVFADFRRPDDYFATMLDLVLSLYGIAPRDPVGVELRSLLEGPVV